MGFSCGIVGLPNVGKSTIFHALTSAEVSIEPFPFSTVQPNTGIVEVPDERLDHLALLTKPERTIPTTLNFVDIAGLVEGASRGEGMGNQFLSHIRDVDALAHVVRCFEDPNISHIAENINPARDIEIVELEIILKDLETIEKRLQKVKKQSKGGSAESIREIELLERIRRWLNDGMQVRQMEVDDEEQGYVSQLFLLSSKPVLYALNIGEADIDYPRKSYIKQVEEIAGNQGAPMIVLCGKVEAEISELPLGERKEFSKAMGIKELGLENLINVGYDLLDLITFFTIDPPETRAWTVIDGTPAPQAAGKIHSDFEKGFIKADVIKYEDLMEFGTVQEVREQGLLSTLGKDYIVEDGDVIHFKFRV